MTDMLSVDPFQNAWSLSLMAAGKWPQANGIRASATCTSARELHTPKVFMYLWLDCPMRPTRG